MKKALSITAVAVVIIIALTALCIHYHNAAKNIPAVITGSAVEIPDGYNYYTKEHIFLEDCLSNRTSKKRVLQSFDDGNPDEETAMIIVPKGADFDAADFYIKAVVSTHYYGADYISLTYDEFDDEIASLAGGKFSFTDHRVAETERTRYVIFSPTDEPCTTVMASVIGGRLVYFTAYSDGDAVSEDEYGVLYDIAMSI